MDGRALAWVQSDPEFGELIRRRSRLAWLLTALTLLIYLGFIFIVAFAPKILAVRIAGATTLGIPVGLFVIASAVVLTGIYVRRANSEFDRLTQRILERAR